MSGLRPFVAAALFLCTAGYLARAARAEPTPTRAPLEQCPLIVGDYRGRALEPFDPATLAQLGNVEYLNRIYVTPAGKPVSLYVGYYASQRSGDTMHSPQNCLPGAGWSPVKSGRLPIVVRDGPSPVGGARAPARTVEVNRYVIEKGLDRQVVLYWYQSHGRVVASEYWAKIYLTLDAVRLNRTDGALVRVIAPVMGLEQDAEREATGFVQSIFPLLAEYLPS